MPFGITWTIWLAMLVQSDAMRLSASRLLRNGWPDLLALNGLLVSRSLYLSLRIDFCRLVAGFDSVAFRISSA